jgi:dipeptidase D
MSKEIRKLEPQVLWNHFADLNAIPRPSKREKKAIKFIQDFGLKLGLETIRDEVGNVIIKKPATKGMEDCIPVILQGHVDMVPQKNKDVDFDFDKQGINMYIDGDWVKAKGTTLGADNGIGVAAAMSVLSSDDIAHPPLEVLVTMDEETGMTGAMALKPGLMDGKIMLNLDSEDEKEITIGCAGGIDITINHTYKQKDSKANVVAYRLTVKGLVGGHSGMEIHLGRGNANKLMNRILWLAAKKFKLHISEIDGGSLRNAIPRESMAVFTVPEDKAKEFRTFVKEQKKLILAEYKSTDPDLAILLESCEKPLKVMRKGTQKKLLSSIYANPSGIYRMSPDVEDLVQTSNNLARVSVKKGKIEIQNLTRSAVDSEKMDMAFAIQSCYESMGAKITMDGAYPGWAPDPHALINTLMTDVYKDEFGFEPHIMACHAGLECGIIKENYQDVDMISFGPNIRGPHSPDERVQISSVGRFWGLLKNTLASIPKKG